MKRIHCADFHALLRCLRFTSPRETPSTRSNVSTLSTSSFLHDETDANLIIEEWIRNRPQYDSMQDGSLLISVVHCLESVRGLIGLADRQMCAEGEEGVSSRLSELSMPQLKREVEKRVERLRKSEKRSECFGFLSLLDRVLVRRKGKQSWIGRTGRGVVPSVRVFA